MWIEIEETCDALIDDDVFKLPLDAREIGEVSGRTAWDAGKIHFFFYSTWTAVAILCW